MITLYIINVFINLILAYIVLFATYKHFGYILLKELVGLIIACLFPVITTIFLLWTIIGSNCGDIKLFEKKNNI